MLKRSNDLTKPTTRAVGLPPKMAATELVADSPATLAMNMFSVAAADAAAAAEPETAARGLLEGTDSWRGRWEQSAKAALSLGR